MENDEARLVASAREGGSDAVAELFRRHWPSVWRAAYSVCGQRALADDVAQEAFVRGISSLGTFDERLIVALHYWLDYETREIAEMLELPLGTVASRLSRALSELRKDLEAEHV